MEKLEKLLQELHKSLIDCPHNIRKRENTYCKWCEEKEIILYKDFYKLKKFLSL